MYKLTVPLGDHPRARLELALTVLTEFASALRISDADVETERWVTERWRRSWSSTDF
jgi:hypothetical protein